MKPFLPLRATLRATVPVLVALTLAVSAAAANITVDATQTVSTVHARDFGLNAVIWDPDASTAQTVSFLQAAGIQVIRIPGGSLSDTYNWSLNKSYSSPGVFNTWHWMSGMDAFAKLIEGLKCQVFVTVNYGSGTPQEAAAWVAYTNASATLQGTSADVNLGVDSNGIDWKTAGYWSAMRAATPLATDDGYNFLRLGRSQPFGLKYWEVGNEVYGSWETDYHTDPHDPYTYATQFQKYIQLMKEVDPTIKVGAVITTGEDSYANYTNHNATNPRTGQTHNGWTPVMLSTLKTLGVTPDFVAFHLYAQQPGQENDATLLQAASAWSNDATELRQQLDDYLGSTAGDTVELDVTENNSVSSNPGKQTTSLVNGLYLADSFGNLIQTQFDSLVWWALRNGPPTDSSGNLAGNQSSSLYGWRQFGDYGVLSMPSTLTGETTYNDAYPTYYILKLLSHFARGGDTVVHAASDNLLLAVYAVKRADGSLGLLVLNKSPTDSLGANISLMGFDPQSTATVYSYGMPQDNAAKTGSGSTDVATSSLGGVGTSFTTNFAPYSATVLSLTPASASPPSITMQPPTTSGQNAMFSVDVSGSPTPTLQWQVQSPGTTTWTDLQDNTTYSGTTTATLSVNLDSVTQAMNGELLRCVATNASGTIDSTTEVLQVIQPLVVTTLAGAPGTSGSADGTGSAARFDGPADVAVGSAGNLYIADAGNDTIRKITPAGVVTTLAGMAGTPDHTDDPPRFNQPAGVTVDSSGNVYVADTDNDTIRKINPDGTVTTLAGMAGASGSADGMGSAARFDGPSGIAVDSSGDLYVSDTLNYTIRKIDASGNVTTLAGSPGASGASDGTGSAARFAGPQGLVLDGSGDLYVADTDNDTIRKIDLTTATVSTVAGLAGTAGSVDGFGSAARLNGPSGIAMDASGDLFVTDMGNSTVREVVVDDGYVATVAGMAGRTGSADGTGSAARFDQPTGIAVDSTGTVYLADTDNDTIRAAAWPQIPAITSQPQNQTVTAGTNVQFSVTATGQPAPTYQWSFDGSAISGATGATLNLSSVQSSDAGNYSVTVSNSAGSVTSGTATLTVNAASGGSGMGGGSSGGGGGGGAMGASFVIGLGLLMVARICLRRKRG